MNVSVNGEWMIFGLASRLIKAGCGLNDNIQRFDRSNKLKCSCLHSCNCINESSWYYLGGCRGNISCFSFYNTCQLLIFKWLRSSTTWITEYKHPRIIDPPLSLIFKRRQGACCFLFCSWEQRILWLCITITKSLLNYLTYVTKNRWCSVDSHFATGVYVIWSCFIWYSTSLMVLWRHFLCLHVLSPYSLHCSWILNISIFFKIYSTVSSNGR